MQNSMETSAASLPGYTLWQLVLYMLRQGTLGFGGPVALVGYMHRDLVEQRQWVSEGDYKEGLAFSQLAIYLGYVQYRIRGATLAGLAFVMPTFLMVLALGWAYVRFGGTFVDGVTAPAIGAITGSVIVLAQRSIIDLPTVLLAVASVALLWRFKKLKELVVVIGAAIVGLVVYPLLHP